MTHPSDMEEKKVYWPNSYGQNDKNKNDVQNNSWKKENNVQKNWGIYLLFRLWTNSKAFSNSGGFFLTCAVIIGNKNL